VLCRSPRRLATPCRHQAVLIAGRRTGQRRSDRRDRLGQVRHQDSRRQTPVCGYLGKKENCVVSVHLGVCRGRYKTLIDNELFLPEDWAADRDRCKAAGIPEDMKHRPKWKIALEELDRAKSNEVPLDWLTFDEEYGKAPGFVCGLDKRNLLFVGEVPKSLSCLAANRSGQRPEATVKGRRADEVVRQSPVFVDQAWQK